jgi:hypothetical protein
MESRSQNAAHFGALAEKAARSRYGLDVDHDSWKDAKDSEGRPWDVKAVMLSRDSPRFRLWETQHTRLKEAGGGYVFVGYIPRGTGIEIKHIKTVRAESIEIEFYGAGSHVKGDQGRVLPGDVF